MKKDGLSQGQLNRELNQHAGVASHWLYGDRRPSIESACRMKERFGIDPNAWMKPPTKPFLTPAAEAQMQAMRPRRQPRKAGLSLWATA
jgi:transcriptional regulator with XRE-family HTH domain